MTRWSATAALQVVVGMRVMLACMEHSMPSAFCAIQSARTRFQTSISALPTTNCCVYCRRDCRRLLYNRPKKAFW